MASFTLHRRDLVLSKAMRAALDESVTTAGQVVPGQLRQRGDWYFLTYLKVQKVKNFDPASFEMETREIDSVRAVAFKLSKEGKLLVQTRCRRSRVVTRAPRATRPSSGTRPGSGR